MNTTGDYVEFETTVTKKMMQDYGCLFHDFSSLHYDDEFAKEVGFNSRVVQGGLISCLIIKCISETFGDSTILKSHYVEFMKPIYPEQVFKIRLTIIKNIRNRLMQLETKILIEDVQYFRGFSKIRIAKDLIQDYFLEYSKYCMN